MSLNSSELNSRRDRAFLHWYRPMFKHTDLLVYGAKAHEIHWQERYRVRGGATSVIYNGVDGNHFDRKAIIASRLALRRQLQVPETGFVLTCVANLLPEKGHAVLLEAVKRLEKDAGVKAHVVLVGDGPERKAIEDRAVELGIADRIRYAGSVRDVRPFLKLADAFALGSIAVETFPNAALEAAAMGLPCIISDVGGAREMFPPGSGGMVYRRGNAEALAERLAEVAGRPASLNSAEAIRADVLRRFGADRMSRRWSEAIWPDGYGLEPVHCHGHGAVLTEAR